MLSTLDTTRPLFTSYLRIRSLASTSSSPELAQARGELETNLQDLSTDLQDLVESVRAAEKDPFRYGLDVEEVGRRRRLVEEVGGEIEDMREELVKAVAGAHVHGGGMRLPSPSAFDAESPREDDYAAFEQQRQVEIMHEQDEALDGVFKTVGNLREQAHVMGRELEEQGEMLDEVDTLTDRLGGKLQGGMKKITTIIRKNEGIFGGEQDDPVSMLMKYRHDVKLLHRSSHLCAYTATYLGHRTMKSFGKKSEKFPSSYQHASLVKAIAKQRPLGLYQSFKSQ